MSEDQELERAMRALGPTAAQVARMQRALQRSEAPPPLWAEWIELLRVRPLAHAGAALAASALFLLLSPLGFILRALLNAAGASS